MDWRIMAAILAVSCVAAGAILASLQADPDGADGLTASALKAGGSPVRGDPSAPVTIVEYGDYQCTYCYRFHQETLAVLLEGPVREGAASLIFKDFALNGPDSVLAAEASHCAGDQGMYWEYHDELYDNWAGERTGWVTRASLSGFAGDVGLDMGEFEDCMDSQRHRGAVLGAYAAAQEIGIDATPSFLVFDGERVVKIRGNQPLDVFERTIQSLG